MLNLTRLSQGFDLQNVISTDLSALSSRTWPFGLEWLPQSAYLVGGSVRDALLGRHSDYLDLDFVLPDGVVETARAIARHYKAGFVLLDEERQIARVVFPQGTADFAQQVGSTLEADLMRRDFTVNAIAYNPQTDRFVDPLQGCLDLQNRQIRMVSATNLQEDPLRLLRAYRQAAQLGFSLEPATQQVIRHLAPLLQRIAAERVQSELNYLLSTEKGTAWLVKVWQDGLLQHWLPDASDRSLDRLAGIDQAAVLLQETLPNFAKELFSYTRTPMGSPPAGKDTTHALPQNPNAQNPLEQKPSGSARNWFVIAKLACLVDFTPMQAETQLRRLKYSRNEIQSVGTVLKFLPDLCAAAGISMTNPCPFGANADGLNWSRREEYFFFQNIGPVFPTAVLLAIAHGISWQAIAPLIQRFLTPGDPVAHPQALLTGQDLMKQLNLSAGPLIGRLLAAIQLARAEGQITTTEEAINLAAEMIDNH